MDIDEEVWKVKWGSNFGYIFWQTAQFGVVENAFKQPERNKVDTLYDGYFKREDRVMVDEVRIIQNHPDFLKYPSRPWMVESFVKMHLWKILQYKYF